MDEGSVATIQAFYNYLAQAGSHGYRKNLNATTIERVRGLTARIFSVAQEMASSKLLPFKHRLLTIKAEKGERHKALPDAEIDHGMNRRVYQGKKLLVFRASTTTTSAPPTARS